MQNPNIPEPLVCGNGTDTTVGIVNLTFAFDSQAEALAFVDQYKNATEVTGTTPEDQRRSEIVRAAFDPFIDDDKLVNLYSLFQELPDREKLVLCFESEDVGGIRLRGSYEPVVGWDNVREAIDLLASHRGQALSQ